MQHSDFVHLHVHTQYSLLDGACLLPDLITAARNYKMPALAITDHGNMFGAIEFYEGCMANGIKPIIGCEMYVAPKSRFDKTTQGISEASYHLIILAKDEQGYRNLMKLVSIGYLEGFYYKPRIDREVLSQYSKGIIGLSSCLKSEFSILALNGQEQALIKLAADFKEIFEKGDFYFELMDNLIPEQKKVNQVLISLGHKLDIPVVATNDVHYLKKTDAPSHDALLCIQTQTTIENPNRLKFQTDEFYFKSPEEMKAIFKETPEAIRNTIEISERCNLELDFTKTYLPHYNPPSGKTREEFLRELCEEGLKRRFPAFDAKILNRLNSELEVINKAGYTSYFLIAWDFVSFAKERGIPVGPGRGSAAGSLASYCLGITDIDPLRYNLLFERFLNPERVSLPDFDIDFCYERRSEVIDYVTQKYGTQNVAQIITFGTMAARAVIRDVGRVMNMPYAEVDRIAKLVPQDPNITLEQALKQEPELRSLYQSDPRITKLIDTSKALEGLTRHASTHAAGVVISGDPLTNHVPIFKTSDDQITTGYAMNSLEKIGLLKMDFLGLRTLTLIDETLKIVERTKGIKIKPEEIPLDDQKTFELLSNAETIGVFQLESSGMRDLLKKLRPDKFEDIVALLALYRPGPIGSGMLDDFIKRRHNIIEVQYDHPLLEPILRETYGIIVYQEQVMMIVSELAGFSLSQADLLRRAIGKKIPEVMEQQRRTFIEGANAKGIGHRLAEKTFDLIEHFAGYGFAKSHSAAYAMTSYRTAYLKANFPIEYITALLTNEKDNTDKVVEYIDEAKRMALKILPPDVNESFSKFTMVGEDAIRFGLGAVKNVGQLAIDSIIETRERLGPFKTLFEFCERTDSRLVNKKVLESLIKCGAFDSFGLFRSQLFAILDNAMDYAQKRQKEKQRGQLLFFTEEVPQTIPDIKEWPESQLLSFEKEILGFYITGHPLARHEKVLKDYSTTLTSKLRDQSEGSRVVIGGIINKVKYTVTKRTNEKMAIMTLEDLDGSIEVLVFPSCYKDYARFVRPNFVVFVNGRLNLREEQPKLVADSIIPIEEAKKKLTRSVLVRLLSQGLDESIFDKVREILLRHHGDIPVYLNLSTKESRSYNILIDKTFFVEPTDELMQELEGIVGKGGVEFVGRER